MRAPLITITCDCGATARGRLRRSVDAARRAARRGTRRQIPAADYDVLVRGVRRYRLPRARPAARCWRLILIPLGRPRRDPVRVPPLRARDRRGRCSRPAAPAPRRRPHAAQHEELEAAAGVAVLGIRRNRTSADIPSCLGQPPGDARHLRRAVRAGGNRDRRRCRGRVGAAADHRQRGRGAARADLARDEVRVHRHRRRSRTRSRRRPPSRCRSRSRSSGCASAARGRSRRCSSSSPSARRACSSSAPTATGSSGARTRS